jgi:ATP-dependent helicase HepA
LHDAPHPLEVCHGVGHNRDPGCEPSRHDIGEAGVIGAFVTVDPDRAGNGRTSLAVARLGTDGLGRLVGAEGTSATVEYFVSPAGPKFERRRVDARRVRRVILWPETPVFWFDERDGNWLRGRITAPEKEGVDPRQELYRVRFPNGRDGLVPGVQLHVRWAHPVEDPVEYLAARVTDTPFFLEGRRKMIGWLAKQRAAFRGLTGLASASIHLHRHQVEIVRRILTDPVQRYLLADEVGLGKTIEACSVVRQHLIDEPSKADVLIIVPPHLVRQWQGELSFRFGIAQADSRVTVVPESDVISGATDRRTPTLLVVDEAHRSSSGAFSNTDPLMATLFAGLQRLAASTPRVLLLSGTPVLRQEDGFLAMLHLLDPGAYPLHDREAFLQRVRNRSAVADAVAQLTDDAPAIFLEDAVAQLEQAFGEDAPLRALSGEVARLAEAIASNPGRIGAIRALRSHATETYKLHRRLLRTRRDDPSIEHLLPVRQGLERIPCEDPMRRIAWDFVEEWRGALPIDGEGKSAAEAGPVFAELVEAALSHPSALAKYVRTRGAALRSCARRDKPAASPAWPGELSWCTRTAEALEEAAGSEPRAEALADWITTSKKKAIVFADAPDVASLVVVTLRQRLGATRVVHFGEDALEGTSDPVARFVAESDVQVIVADKRAEEGLNLQGTRAVLVHYDLPFAPTRIEQRNGRIDRLEGLRTPRFIAFDGSSPYEQAWMSFLETTVRVFERSVAPLQYLLAESAQRLRHHLVSQGVYAFAEEAVMLNGPGGLEDELRVIRQQEGLDSLVFASGVDDAFFSTLCEDDEAASKEDGTDCEEWLCRRLKFRRSGVHHGQRTQDFHYEYALADRPLLPLQAVVTNLGQSIDAARSGPTVMKLGRFTFDRERAVDDKSVRLLRPGNPFLEGVENLVRCDDRGAAFAMWRCDSTMQAGEARLFFRVEFIVEANVEGARAVLDEALGAPEALRRFADAAFPPLTRHVWVDVDGRSVTAESWLSRLDLPYKQPRDTNLRTSRWLLADRACPVHDWSGLCRKAREAAEDALWDENLRRIRAEAVGRLEESQVAHRAQWASRIARISKGPARDAEVISARQSERLDASLLVGLRQPSVRVDSMGAVYLSSTPLKGA